MMLLLGWGLLTGRQGQGSEVIRPMPLKGIQGPCPFYVSPDISALLRVGHQSCRGKNNSDQSTKQVANQSNR